RMRLTEKPVTVAIRVVTSCSGLPLAMLVAERSSAAPPQPTSCSRQKAWFLSAKKGVGLNGKLAIDPDCVGSASCIAGFSAGRRKDGSQLRSGAPPRSLLPSLPLRRRRSRSDCRPPSPVCRRCRVRQPVAHCCAVGCPGRRSRSQRALAGDRLPLRGQPPRYSPCSEG